MQTNSKDKINQRVLLAYILLAGFALFSGFSLWRGTAMLSRLNESEATVSGKLLQVHELSSRIQEAEKQARAYFLTRDKSDLTLYHYLIDSIEIQIDYLVNLPGNSPGRIQSLQSISTILTEKKDIIRQLSLINLQKEQEIIYQRAMDEFGMFAYEPLRVPMVVKSEQVTHIDSVFENSDQPGFFHKLRRGSKENQKLTRVNIEKTTLYDTLVHLIPVQDTLVEGFRQTLDKIKSRGDHVWKQILINESKLLHADKILLDKTREVIKSIEDAELGIVLSTIDQYRVKTRSTIQWIVFAGIVAFLISILLVYLIIRDVNRQKTYRLALQSANEHADELIRLKELFVASMSHEIRTPLTGIIGLTSQLKNQDLTSESRPMIYHLEKCSQHLYALVNNVLDASRIHSGNLTIELRRFNLDQLLTDTVDVYLPQSQAKKLSLKVENNGAIPYKLTGDPDRLRQVIGNLLHNAIKFTTSGLITLKREIIEETSEGFKLKISVLDTGPGIEKARQETIFEPFTRAMTIQEGTQAGTGLGLSISKKIIDSMGGKLELSSEPGKGSCFYFTLDFEKASNEQPSQQAPISEPGISSGKPLKILTIEDDDTTVLVLKSIARKYGIKIEFAGNTTEGMKKISHSDPDMVLCDFHLPGQSGPEFVKELRVGDNHSLPVIAFTAQPTTKNALQEMGFNGLISKPFLEETLIQEIERIAGNTLTKVKEQIPSRPVSLDYDLGKVMQFTGEDTQALEEVIRSFVNQTQLELEAISFAFRESNRQIIADKAHKLLPLFHQFGIKSLVDTLQVLEKNRELIPDPNDLGLIVENLVQKTRVVIDRIREDYSIDG